MATGHPAKFPQAVMEAIGHTVPPPPQLDGLNLLSQPAVKIPPAKSALARVLLS